MDGIVQTYADALEEAAIKALSGLRDKNKARQLEKAISEYEKAKKVEVKNGKTNRLGKGKRSSGTEEN